MNLEQFMQLTNPKSIAAKSVDTVTNDSEPTPTPMFGGPLVYTVTYLDDMFDGVGSAIDEYIESFTDITDAMELVHELTTHPYHCWNDDDGYTMTSDIISVKLSFSTAV